MKLHKTTRSAAMSVVRLGLICCMTTLFSISLLAQTRTVSGTVKDQSGEPLIGVSVQLKGDAKVGTITDMQGKFSLSAPANSSLVFSYVGYISQTIPASQAHMTVTLSEDTKKLDEVVVIGYGTVKKRDLTGAVSSVKQADIVQTPTGNAMEAIQGRIPGMDITRTSGGAGSGVNILIRGTKTIGYTDMYGNKTRNTSPLFIIDGVQGGSYEDLNPNDIESIDVLKDASSTAIYGSLGANGVVIITTKRGKSDEKVNVTLDSYYGVNGWVSYPKSNTGEAYMNVRREAYRTVGQWASTADDYKIFSAEEWQSIQNNQWVDWRNLLTVQGKEQSHNVTLSSNKGKVKTYFSLGYYNEQGVFKNDNLSKYSFRGNVDYEVSKWLQVGMNTQLTYNDQDKVSSSMLTQAMTYVPLGTPYNADGSINLFPVSGDMSKLSPLANYASANKAVNNTISLKTFSTGYVIIQPTKELKLRSNVSATIGASRNGTFNGQYSTDQYGGSYVNMAGATNQLNRYFSWDNILTYNKKFGEHNLEATAISSWTKRMDESYYGAGTNQLVDSYLYYALNATDATSRLLSSNYIQSQTLGFAGRLSYSYLGKYFFTATGRWDGSSTLAPGHKWDFFPSASAAWRISDEPFMKGASNWLSNLKLRLSYGTTGNAGAPAYATQGGVSANTKMGFNDNSATTYQYSNLVGNAGLGWEKSTTTNLGVDFSVFKGRVDLNVDLYNIDTKDILLGRSLPPSTGAGGAGSAQFSTYTNIGKTNNRGIEIALNTVNIQTKKFKWNSTVTFAANKEKIVSLVANADIIQGQNPETSSLLIGRPINSFYSYKLAGVWQLGQEAEMAQYKLNGTANAFKPGDLHVVDYTQDGNITTADRQYLGSTSPKWTAGLNNTFSYKGFDLNMYLVARWGQMINAQFIGRYDPSGVSNFPSYFSYWTPENPSNDFPRPKKDGHLYDYFGYMSLNYVDGSYVKLKTVSLGYTIPAAITKKVGISKLRLYATASNLLTVVKSHMIKYYDPERGGDETMPLTKQLVFGVNLGF